MFDDSPEDPTKRSSKKLAEGTHRVRAGWTKTRKAVDSCLVEALAGRDGPSGGHSRAFSLIDRAACFETYSKNLKGVLEKMRWRPMSIFPHSAAQGGRSVHMLVVAY